MSGPDFLTEGEWTEVTARLLGYKVGWAKSYSLARRADIYTYYVTIPDGGVIITESYGMDRGDGLRHSSVTEHLKNVYGLVYPGQLQNK